MKAKFIALILGLMVLPTFLIVSAQTEEEVGTEIDSCEIVQEKIQEKIQSYQTNKPEHTLNYQILYLKIAAFANKAEVLGYEADELYKDLDKLEKLIEIFETNYEDFIDALTKTGKSACGKEEIYARDFVKAKEALGDIRKSTIDITSLYQNNIRQDILALEVVKNE